MELELGLKITKTKDDIDSISEYQFMKDAGPVFKSRETNTMFILTAHLKGYKRNNIDININKDGNKISIRGKKPIQEMVMMGWVMQRKVVDVKGFNKVFKIPYGVNLDKIKANYNEEEWMLNIVMPKLVKGICGLKIEEIKEQEFDKGKIEQGKSGFDHVFSNVGETSQKGSKQFEFQHMEGSENIIGEMIDDTKKEINEEGIQKEVGEYKLRIDDGNGERSLREKGGKKENEVSKKSEIDQSVVGLFMSKEIEDASQDKEFEDQKLNSRSVDKRLDDVNRDLIGSTIKKDKEESKLRIKDSMVKDTSQLGFEESKQKEFEEPKCESKVRLEESMKESSKGPFEAMKVPKLDENVVDHIPNNIGCINQTQLKEEYEKAPFETYEDVQKTMFGDTVQKEIIKPNKEGFDAKITINEEFPKNLPKNNQKMQETKNEKEEAWRKEAEYFAEKGEGERLKMMHVEESDNEIKDNDKQQVAEIEGSNKFNDAKKEEQKEVMKESLVENGSLMVQGDESKERTKKIVQEEEDKIENSIVKLKGEGSTKMHVEPNEPFEGENVNNGIFDGRDTKMFHEIEQTKDVNEKGANVEHYLKKVNRDKYEMIQNEGFKKNKTKAKDEWFLQEEMSKERSKANKAAKEDLPMKFFDSPFDSRVGEKDTRIEKVKGVKESEKESSMKSFEANEDVHKDFVKSKLESKDVDQESVRENANEEGVEAERNEDIQNYLPKSTREQNEGLNVQKRRKIKDDKENVGKRKGNEIEYFVEKGEGDRLKTMHVKEMETMQDEIEKSEYGIKESGQQHANENNGKEMYEMSKSDTEEVPRKVAKIDGSNEFDVAKEEEKNEVLNEALVENDSLVEMVQGEESNQMTKEIVREDENKIEYNIENLKENDHFGGDKAEEKIEKEIRNQKLESIHELSEKENVNIGIFDGRKENKFQEMKQIEDLKENNAKIENFAKTMNEKMQNEDEDLKTNTTKEKDECCLQEEISEGRCQATKERKEDFSMKMLDSLIDARERPNDREMEKTKGIKEESAKLKREKDEKIQVEENDGLRNDIIKRKQNESEETKLVTKFKDQQSLPKEKIKGRNEASTLKRENSIKTEEFQGFDIETSKILFEEPEENNSNAKEIETPKREFQSVASTGFKEFDYVNAKDKKQNMKMLPPKFQSKETHESKDETINQDILSQKKTKEGGEQCREQFEVEEKDKSCEGSKAKYKGFLESERQDDTKDIQNEQNDTLKQEMHLVQELKKREKGEFLNRETMREKTDEPENKYKTQNTNDENFKTHGEITKDGIENEKCIHETMKTTQEKEAEPLESSLKNDIAEMKTKRPLELENTIVQWKFPKIKDQHDYGTQEMKIEGIVEENVDSLQPQVFDAEENVLQKKREPKVVTIEEKNVSTLQREIRKTTQTTEEKAKRVEEKVHDTPHRELQREIQEVTSKMVEQRPKINQQSSNELNRKSEENVDSLPPHFLDEQEVLRVQEKNDKKGFHAPNIVEEDRVLKKREGPMVAKNEETNNSSTLKRVSGKSKRVEEKVHQTPKRGHQRELEVISKIEIEAQTTVEKTLIKGVERKEPLELTSPPNIVNEILKVEEKHEEKEGEKHIQVLEATIAKGNEDRGNQYVQEENNKKGFQTQKTLDEEKVVKQMEEAKVAKSEETKDDSAFKRQDGKTTQASKFDKSSSGSKRVGEKMLETSERNHQRELEVTSKMDNERHIQELEANISKEKDRVEANAKIYKKQLNHFPSSKEPFQQFEVEGERKTKKNDSKLEVQESTKSKAGQEIEQCINKDMEAKHGIEEQKECEDETSEEKKYNKIPKVEEENEVKRHIQVLEATISKEKDRVEQKEDTSNQLNSMPPKNSPTKKHVHSIEDSPTLEVVDDKVVQQLEVPSTSCTQQFEVEGEEKAKKMESKRGQESEQCINNDEEAKHGKEEINDEEKDYEQVFEEQKEGEEEPRGGKKENAKISKEFFVPLVIVGSTLIVTLIAIFVRQRRARKR